ncbi:hypothetical protein A5844_002378 [Enterococcus sp. 10A9_DIV0425]|uniref:Helix-turn-helix domain-containing protein n=1 Tax=Candidatus Enterococcus wittei TaxID=1987383 RepID=A0A242JWV6_9ENTE|nr:hypothetical protein [Enterococcus sp. 10A9_DIV0425]OTP09599.1 hypothetical protein A5844_002378 [Enterococcus sp. 10A9_DIV0425]
MIEVEKALLRWEDENFNKVYFMVKEAIETAKGERDIVKQKYCAEHFQISVNTLKDWVSYGCPEIRLDSGMVLYSKKAIREWLLLYQK